MRACATRLSANYLGYIWEHSGATGWKGGFSQSQEPSRRSWLLLLSTFKLTELKSKHLHSEGITSNESFHRGSSSSAYRPRRIMKYKESAYVQHAQDAFWCRASEHKHKALNVRCFHSRLGNDRQWGRFPQSVCSRALSHSRNFLHVHFHTRETLRLIKATCWSFGGKF